MSGKYTVFKYEKKRQILLLNKSFIFNRFKINVSDRPMIDEKMEGIVDVVENKSDIIYTLTIILDIVNH